MGTIAIIGAGRVGRALARELRRAGESVTLRAARRGSPSRIAAELVVLAVRDGDLEAWAQRLASCTQLAAGTAVVHCAGARDPEVLSALSGKAAIGKMHPLISFAGSPSPPLAGACMGLAGDRLAVRRGRQVARALGMQPVDIGQLDSRLYHTAAVMLAGGAAALTGAAVELAIVAGVDPTKAPAMFAALLRSVADNVSTLGLPAALTGPVRRGDVHTIENHLEQLRRRLPAALALYQTLVRAQLELARQLDEVPLEDFDAIAIALQRSSNRARRRRNRRKDGGA